MFAQRQIYRLGGLTCIQVIGELSRVSREPPRVSNDLDTGHQQRNLAAKYCSPSRLDPFDLNDAFRLRA